MREGKREDVEFHEFTSQALRLHRSGSFENLLCQHLIISVAADPIIKIRLVCEASWIVDPKSISLDLNLVETIYAVSLGFLNTNPEADFLCMTWGFSPTLENYERFIAPWRRKTPLSFQTYCISETEKKRECLNRVSCEAERFFLITSELNLSHYSYYVLKSEFLRWATPLIMGIFEKLSRLVQPDLYKEMLQIFKSRVDQP